MQTPKKLDLQHIFTWLLADGIIDQAHVKAGYNQALLCNTIGAMHPLTAVAQCKILSALPPHRLRTLDWLTEWVAVFFYSNCRRHAKPARCV